METKPYRIQSPEDIAKDYAGNKQKIAEAMQMGVVDPTAGVLAGMFIDRMRSAQMQEMAPQRTVAQQVMGPPPAPMGAPAAPMGPPAGLGATPEAAMMAPPMPQQAPPPGMAAGGMFEAPYMKDGGLSELPVPDGMFDENRDGSYAGGGIIAFAGAGEARVGGGFGDYIEQMVRKLDPNIQISGRARTPARNAEVGGVAGSYHLIDAARDIRTPEGMEKSDFIAQLKSVFGPDYDVLPSKGRSVHVEPGPKLGEKVRAGARPSDAPSIMPERNLGTAEGRVGSLGDYVGVAQRFMKPSEEELASEEKMRARLTEIGSDEYYEKQRKDSMWETLATIGFNMASSKAPGVLQAIGEAAAAALPGARADKKERKELKDRALDGLVALGARNRQRANEAFKVGADLYKSGVEVEQAEKLMAFREKELTSREEEARLNRITQKEIASLRPSNPSDLEIMMAIMQNGTPEQKTALKEVMELKKQQSGMALVGDPTANTGVDLSKWGQATVVPQ